MYSNEMTNYIVSEYTRDSSPATVDRLAIELDRPRRGIISKLAIAGVYRRPERTSKTGEPVTSKEQLVREIGEAFGIEVPTLVKSGKLDLQTLHTALHDPLQVRAHLVDLEYDD